MVTDRSSIYHSYYNRLCIRTLSGLLSAKRARILAPAPTPKPITDLRPKWDSTNSSCEASSSIVG